MTKNKYARAARVMERLQTNLPMVKKLVVELLQAAARLPEGVDAVEALGIRPSVLWFALRMEEQLRKNDWKGGWERDEAAALLSRLHEETRELAQAVGGEGDVVKEAADVANFAMMNADNEARR